ncbi:tetratricopeptide repeat protein [Sorangium sp. So ce1335]|uniref:tetratricopeptide repeat protein n=1 Tax=Sorangium sp. So ce1335 TaxID=3133335 RepID=UPI003F5E5BC0
MFSADRSARVLAPIALAAALIVPGPALAQKVDRHAAVTAQALYDQATAEMDAGRFASACGKLEEVARLVPEGLGAKLTLGQCYEAWGKLASAWAQYTIVEALAAKAGQAERSARAGAWAAALKPRLATLTVHVPEAVRAYPGLAITRDGVPLGRAQWDAALPVDTGEHEIVAKARNRATWRRSTVVTADGEAVSVAIPALEPDRRDPPASASRTPRSAAGGAQRAAGLVVGGAGLVGAGVGVFFGVRAAIKLNESNAGGHCHDGNICDEVGYAARRQAVTAGDVSTVLLIAGGAVLAGGVALFLTAPRPEGPGAHIALGPRGIALRGGF